MRYPPNVVAASLQVYAAEACGLDLPIHLQYLFQLLELLCFGAEYEAQGRRSPLTRLIVELPFRHGKSQACTRAFPSFYLGHHPTDEVLITTHNGRLARDFGRSTRNTMQSEEYAQVFPHVAVAGDSGAQDWFHSVYRPPARLAEPFLGLRGLRRGEGAFRVYGRESGCAGTGAHLAIIDDMVDEKDQYSDAVWEEARRAYRAIRTRIMKGGKIVVPQTRYRDDDLVGWLLREHAHEGWVRVSLPVTVDEEVRIVLPNGTVWVREPGSLLWPGGPMDAGTPEGLRRLMASLLPHEVSAQLFCRPTSPDANPFKPGRWRKAPPPEGFQRVVGSVDGSKGKHSQSAILTVGELGRDLHLLFGLAARLGYADLRATVVEVAVKFGWTEAVIEDKSVGEALIQDLPTTPGWPGIPIYAVKPLADKVTRALHVAPEADERLVLPLGDRDEVPWLPPLVLELAGFPTAARNDVADALSQLLAHCKASRPRVDLKAARDFARQLAAGLARGSRGNPYL